MLKKRTNRIGAAKIGIVVSIRTPWKIGSVYLKWNPSSSSYSEIGLF